MKTRYSNVRLITLAALLAGLCGTLTTILLADPPSSTAAPATATTGTAAYAGALGSALNSVSLTGTQGLWGANLNNQAFVWEGDSITATPNGASVQSWAGLLSGITSGTGGVMASGTAYGFFNGHGKAYITAVGGSVISGSSTGYLGAPETISTSWSGTTSTLNLSGSCYSILGPMAVTGTNIAYGTTGTLSNSGTTLTLSQPTLGPSGTTVTIRLGGQNVQDRYASQVYPHRPAANGGDGGPRSMFFLMGGANPLHIGENAATIIAELTNVCNQAKGDGFTVVLSTILPTVGQNWWSFSQDLQRQIVNDAIRRRLIPCDIVVDSCEAISGDSFINPVEFDVNGVHPLAQANVVLANYYNSALLAGGYIYKATPGFVDPPTTFQNSITLNNGILYTGSFAGNDFDLGNTGEWFSIKQPNMPNATNAWVGFGKDSSGFDSARLTYTLHSAGADPSNAVSLGVVNGPAYIVNGYGQSYLNISATTAQSLSSNLVRSTIDSAGAFVGMLIYNDQNGLNNTGIEETQSLLSAGALNEGFLVGHDTANAGNIGGLGFIYNSSGASSNAVTIGISGETATSQDAYFFKSGDVAIGTGTDSGYGFEVSNTAKMDSNLTVSGTLVLTGTASTPINTGTVAFWVKGAVLSGTTTLTGRFPLYQ